MPKPITDDNIDRDRYYMNYVNTYLERDGMRAVKLYPGRYAKRQHAADFGTNARRCLCVGHDLQLVRAGKGDNVRTLRQALRRAKMQGIFPHAYRLPIYPAVKQIDGT